MSHTPNHFDVRFPEANKYLFEVVIIPLWCAFDVFILFFGAFLFVDRVVRAVFFVFTSFGFFNANGFFDVVVFATLRALL
jgi:hypothetical protein